MTDEGRRGDPMDAIEVSEAMKNYATSSWVLFVALKEEGFSEAQALKIVAAAAHGAFGGKLEAA